jgi:hypothetical protein
MLTKIIFSVIAVVFCLVQVNISQADDSLRNAERVFDRNGRRCAAESHELIFSPSKSDPRSVKFITHGGTMDKDCCLGKAAGNYVFVTFYDSSNQKMGNTVPLPVWAPNARSWKKFEYDVTDAMSASKWSDVVRFTVTFTGMGGCS